MRALTYFIRSKYVLRVTVVLAVMMAWMMPAMAQHPFTLTTADDVTNGTETLYWIESNGADGFYMIPDPNETNASTTNAPNEKMLWYFMDAGIVDGKQYYYVVNYSTRLYLKLIGTLGDHNSIGVGANEGDLCKFFVVASGTKWALRPKSGVTGYTVNKRGSNVSYGGQYYLKSSTAGITDVNSMWDFIAENDVQWAHPFTNSTSSDKHYYLIQNRHSSYTSFYMSTDASNYVTVSNEVNDNRIWYFEEASSDASIPNLKYYYIVNAETGNYMYFNSNNLTGTSSLSNAFKIQSHSGDDDDIFQFAIVNAKGNSYSAYSIMPKKLMGLYDNKYTSLGVSSMENGKKMATRNDRGSNDNTAHWVFVETVYPSSCSTPTITYSSETGKITITATPADADIHYTTDGVTVPSSTVGTLYTAPFDVSSPVTIKAIATKTGYDPSEVATVSFDQVATPGFELTDDAKVRLTCATSGASIYYAMGTTQPTSVTIDPSNLYSEPIENAAGQYITAVAVKDGLWINSTLLQTGQIMFPCAKPVITKTSATTFTITCSYPTSGVHIYYNTGDGNQADPTDASTEYQNAVTFNENELPFTVKAIAYADGYSPSAVATQRLTKDLIQDTDGYYKIASSEDFATFISMVNENAANAGANYKIIVDIDASGVNPITEAFTGELKSVAKADGTFPVVSYLSHAIFNTIDGGTVKNVILDNVGISSGTNVGAICNEATGDSRIYNCGVLATTSSSIGGSGYVGGLVGLLGGTSHVVNCFSFATITGGSDVGGIVGYNNGDSYWTKGDAGALHVETMVMNCMFYGDITGGSTVSPVYGGNNINNVYVDDDSHIGLNTFNYYAYDELQTAAITTDKYNCALAVEERYLHRFEFYRLLLNSNKKLAAIYASTSTTTVQPEEMAKWVLETADRTIANPKPYPILKEPGRYYPSIINMDATHADQITLDENGQIPEASRNKGGKLGTLEVIISSVGSNAPSGANIINGNLNLVRTDKDYDHYNYNYDKVQLPYYSEVGTNNYTGNRVVTGWKITNITPVANDPYTSSNYPSSGIRDYPDHNYADRKSSNKDLYSVSGRVFSQGAYFDVPYGVTSITIEPYWAKATYVADATYDVVYDNTYSSKQNVTQLGTQVGSGATFNGQVIKTSVSAALSYISSNLGGYGSTVYDNAVVLVGNLHLSNVPSDETTPFTMMSVDMDNDHEPDYSLIYHHIGRKKIAPIRYDFLPIPGTAQAQKPNGASLVCNFTIFKTKGWFEATNTSLFYTTQVEYENVKEFGNGVYKADAPLILQGGVIEQFVSTQMDTVRGNTIYIHLGGNVWIHEFGMGTHSDGSYSTPHVPVSVTGGDYDGFYLTGTYNSNAHIRDDNAECYISGGRFGEVAGAAQEQIGKTNSATNGNVRWQIYNADITSFFGGGVNDAKPVQGNVTTEIYNSHVNLFCGGPKFGNMATGKTVTSTAKGCVFNRFFGAGYGGSSYSRKKYYDKDVIPNNTLWTTLQGYYTGDRGKYYDGVTTGSSQISGTNYGKKGPGVATDFDYEFFVWSTGKVGVRLFVKFVSFSLAQCNDVESNLDKCIINGNFYGGGSLGKVSGTATSELKDCTVTGNVFGAGFSASFEPIPVRRAGFTSLPNYNSASGMFESGVFSETDDFSWMHKDAYPGNGTVGFLDDGGNYTMSGTNVVTTVDISKTNLGSVGSAKLTLKGTTTVGGNVFGGGEQSTVNGTGTLGNTEVYLQGKAHVTGNVYGGGDNGSVAGDSSVTIEPEL